MSGIVQVKLVTELKQKMAKAFEVFSRKPSDTSFAAFTELARKFNEASKSAPYLYANLDMKIGQEIVI